MLRSVGVQVQKLKYKSLVQGAVQDAKCCGTSAMTQEPMQVLSAMVLVQRLKNKASSAEVQVPSASLSWGTAGRH